MERRIRKSQKINMVDGITLYSCSGCDEYKARKFFSTANTIAGVRSVCKKCDAAKTYAREARAVGRVRIKKRISANRKSAIMRDAQDRYDRFIVDKNRTVSLSQSMIDRIIFDAKNSTNAIVADMVGVHTDTIRNISSGRRRGVRIDSIILLLEYYQCDETMSNVFPCVSTFVPDGYRWSMNHKCCVSCGMVGSRHFKDGVCRVCVYRIEKNLPLKSFRNQWSRMHITCVSCGRTDRKHKSRGLCDVCNSRRKYHENKSREGALV